MLGECGEVTHATDYCMEFVMAAAAAAAASVAIGVECVAADLGSAESSARVEAPAAGTARETIALASVLDRTMATPRILHLALQ